MAIPAKSTVRCETPRCRDYVERHGENYHSVFPNSYPPAHIPDSVAKCEQCGGHYNGQEWIHKCGKCGKEVAPGELVGLFVPHSCGDCQGKRIEEEKRKGHVCNNCRQVYALCCC